MDPEETVSNNLAGEVDDGVFEYVLTPPPPPPHPTCSRPSCPTRARVATRMAAPSGAPPCRVAPDNRISNTTSPSANGPNIKLLVSLNFPNDSGFDNEAEANGDDVPLWMSTGSLSKEELDRVKTETSRDDNLALEESPVQEKYRQHNGGKKLQSKLQWDVDATETGGVNQKCLCQSFSPDGRMVAIGTTGGLIKIVNVTGDTPSLRGNIEAVKGKEIDPITSVKFQPCVAGSDAQQNLLLACTAGGKLFQYHSTTGQLIWKSQEEGNKLFASAYLCDGKHFVTGGSDSTLRIYDAERRKRVTVFQKGGYRTVGHTSNIYSICGHPSDPNVFCSSGWDSCLNIYDLRSPVPVASTHGPYVSGDAVDIARDNEHHIVTGSRRTSNTLQLWDFRVNKEPLNYVKLQTNLPFKKHESEAPCLLYGARFVTHGIFGKPCIIAGGGGENPLARTFDRELLKNTGTLIAGAPVYSIDVHHDPNDEEKSKVSVLLSSKLQLFQGLSVDKAAPKGRGRGRASVKTMSLEYDIRKSKVPPKWNKH